MFLRKLEKGECRQHGTRCWAAALMECDNCHGEFVLHGVTNARTVRKYCSIKCQREGSAAFIAQAIENKKRYHRIKYGTPPPNQAEALR